MKNPQSSLPPGFRFHPTDEELILHYLKKKLASTPFPVSVIADVDIYKFDPWDLPDYTLLIRDLFVLFLDDWVLCRIYKKSLALTSSPRALISKTLLPISSKNTLMPQKSCSFSNLFDAKDYSMLRSFLADTQFNPAGFESNPTLNGSTAQLDQTFFGNIDTASNSNSTSSDYFLQKLPQLNTSTPNYMQENKLKRQVSHLDEDMLIPSKKYTNSCSFTNTSNNAQTDMGQYSFLSQQFLNQQLLLSPHLQFPG
ncbi:hypothetical protein SADUNF_Sadunf13G0045400 [Salix dunnii]|uniref:NAC domain-containing protein n=1 Tax=Salix dunnii TaxID=1413687 RepID=A0A835JFG3_9ROSI|nr:hypothetical protein SADUNF_Sadunf13G0045400 [Salix dunnii]